LLVHELAERSLLFWAALQDKHHPFHGCGVRDDSPIEFGSRERVHVALEAHELRFIDGLGDAGGDGRRLSGRRAIGLGLGCGAKRRERQNQYKKEKGIAKYQRLQFHIPSTLQIWIRFPQNTSGLKAWPFGQWNNFQKWRLADWGLHRKRFTVELVKAITDDKKTL
jgi:hypothetical protein